MREQVSVLVHRAALHRHSVPDGGNGLVEPSRAVDSSRKRSEVRLIRGSPNGVHHARPQPCCPGRHRLEQVVVIHRKRWSPSTGNLGRHGPARAIIASNPSEALDQSRQTNAKAGGSRLAFLSESEDDAQRNDAFGRPSGLSKARTDQGLSLLLCNNVVSEKTEPAWNSIAACHSAASCLRNASKPWLLRHLGSADYRLTSVAGRLLPKRRTRSRVHCLTS